MIAETTQLLRTQLAIAFHVTFPGVEKDPFHVAQRFLQATRHSSRAKVRELAKECDCFVGTKQVLPMRQTQRWSCMGVSCKTSHTLARTCAGRERKGDCILTRRFNDRNSCDRVRGCSIFSTMSRRSSSSGRRVRTHLLLHKHSLTDWGETVCSYGDDETAREEPGVTTKTQTRERASSGHFSFSTSHRSPAVVILCSELDA